MKICKQRILLTLALVLVTSTLAQVFSFGKCPNVQVKQNFQLESYMGKWYENRRFFAIFEVFSSCVSANYSLKNDSHVRVINQGYIKFLKKNNVAIGDAYAPDANETAKLKVKFGNAPSGDYWVLDTDYDSYSIVYSCSTFVGFLKIEFAWILTRDRNGLSDAKIQELLQYMSSYDINVNRFAVTDQSNCPN
ncbi:hypothetical protein CHS0354_026638 [Potamilus streckersoni]|uniref:Apolipoprotein D n=1 Tax=Potamilus streckersoni TaxID=2493646 RepID=A0AAE0W3S9_9BIVA|nr:hypothetical protein CHS0354_026638 [Potamilus streckersoni]